VQLGNEGKIRGVGLIWYHGQTAVFRARLLSLVMREERPQPIKERRFTNRRLFRSAVSNRRSLKLLDVPSSAPFRTSDFDFGPASGSYPALYVRRHEPA
jgi:hypothetical protein